MDEPFNAFVYLEALLPTKDLDITIPFKDAPKLITGNHGRDNSIGRT